MKNEENENEWRIKACIVERLQTSVVSNTRTNLGHGCQLLDWNQLSSQCGVAFFCVFVLIDYTGVFKIWFKSKYLSLPSNLTVLFCVS